MENSHTWWKMKTLKRFGFFPSTPVAQAVDDLKRHMQECADSMEDNMLAYLEAGHDYLVDAGIARDLIDPEHPIICVPNVKTDGEWAWTIDVIHYLKKYHIKLPSELVATMKRNNWVVPEVTDFSELALS
jgi:hypothetical protein